MRRASSLNLPCGHASLLAKEHPEKSEYSAIGDAFHAGAAALEGPSYVMDRNREIYRATLDALSPESRSQVHAMVQRWTHWRMANMPATGVQVEVAVALDADGILCAPESPGALTGHIDLMWLDDGSADGFGKVAKVLDHKTGLQLHTPPPDENLQLAAYGIAAMQVLQADGYQVGIAYHKPGEDPRVVFGASEPDADAAWERVRASALLDPVVAMVGSHCDGCYVRSHCRAWMLPAMEAGPEGLEPFTKRGELTQAEALRGLHLLKAWEDIGKRARARLEDFARATPIVDGEREWSPSTQHGRTTIDSEVAKRAGLFTALCAAGALKTGNDYEVFRWKKR